VDIGGRGDDVYTVHYKDLAAVVSRTPLVVYDPTRENVLAHVHVNEVTIEQGFTPVPMSFGTLFKTEKDIVEFLEDTYDALRDVLVKMKDKLEFGLRVNWAREEVLAEIEPLRKSKQIGSSLQAKVVVSATTAELAQLEPYAKQLPMIFIVSDVELRPAPDDVEAHTEARPRVVIERAGGVKCERCWRYVPEVSADPAWAGLCDLQQADALDWHRAASHPSTHRSADIPVSHLRWRPDRRRFAGALNPNKKARRKHRALSLGGRRQS